MATSTTKKSGRGGQRAKFSRRPPRPSKAKQPLNPLALEDDLKAIGMRVPIEEWKKLPRDFNENLDHYLYGSPRKKPARE